MLDSEIISLFIPSSEEETGTSQQVHFSQTKSSFLFSDIKDDQRSFSVSVVESLISFVQRSLADYRLWSSSRLFWAFFWLNIRNL